MLKRYRTLGAMLALGEFTVADVAALAEVQPSTVRTTLRRDSRYVEPAGTEATGRRGGQPIKWRLRPETREDLRSRLQALEQQGVGPWFNDSLYVGLTVPAGIIAAEYVLLRQIPATIDPSERADLIRLARGHIDAADALGSTESAVRVQAGLQTIALHRQIVSLLLDLEQSEQIAEPVSPADAARKRQQAIKELLITAGKVNEDSLTDAIRAYVDHSFTFLSA